MRKREREEEWTMCRRQKRRLVDYRCVRITKIATALAIMRHYDTCVAIQWNLIMRDEAGHIRPSAWLYPALRRVIHGPTADYSWPGSVRSRPAVFVSRVDYFSTLDRPCLRRPLSVGCPRRPMCCHRRCRLEQAAA